MKTEEKQASSNKKLLKNLKRRERPVKTGWGPVSAILVTLGVYFGAQILAGYVVVQYLFIAGNSKDEIPDLVDQSTVLQFGFILFAEIFSILLLWMFLKRRKISWQRIGLKKPTSNNLLYSLPAYAVYFIIILITFGFVEKFVPSINVSQEQQVGFDNASGPGALIFVFLALVILPALVEEIMVRGFLYGGLRNKMKPLAAALIASLVFGAAHLQFGSGEKLLWIAAIDTFILSMTLIWLREKTGNIWAGVIVHMLKNCLAFLALFVFKAT